MSWSEKDTEKTLDLGQVIKFMPSFENVVVSFIEGESMSLKDCVEKHTLLYKIKVHSVMTLTNKIHGVDKMVIFASK